MHGPYLPSLPTTKLLTDVAIGVGNTRNAGPDRVACRRDRRFA
jgi:hypothetical protein